ncbi:hypothetical protein GURASL_19710 [Geotalea uraniireducens]|uniref:BioF2-like acetyltransferase domain-containing protein n=1 Tax=Geotalea uraniireducens TaxID=351604 RepID=A0ABM8EKR1_9BACT|nr:FemAB family XrtA/PEP-CTERM system-associated protein [Geotalea uraniireducens]BDV43048.1 hypothetical protein GURASL_19710 [Geotalea uraniireducens]
MNVQLCYDSRTWDDFVASRPEATNYHRYGWRTVIERAFGHRTYYLMATDERDQVCGVLPLTHMKSALFGSFLVSLPFFNYGGMLCATDDAARGLLERSRQLLDEVGAEYAELRHLHPTGKALPSKEHKVTMLLALQDDAESQWKALDAKVRNQVRKAEKSGLTTVVGHCELLDGFYEVFCRNMRDLGTPVYSKELFRQVLEVFPETTRIISVILDGRTVAAGLLTWYRDTLEVPWASSIRDVRELCPNNLLYWEAIRFAIGNGSRHFDFGRSTPGEGTYRFKKQWGAEPHQLHWDYLLNPGAALPELNPANPKYRLAISLWQRLPVAVTKLLGPPIVRNIP